MPLTCLNPEGRSILSINLSRDAWEALRRDNRQHLHLRFSCCETPVILKKSSRGLQYFAHTPGGECTSGPESEAHRYLKAIAVDAARAAGWTARAEVSDMIPSGEEWRADVLAEKGQATVAIEI